MDEIVELFKEWGPKQYNNDGKLFEVKSISNYHSSLNTILVKLDLVAICGYEKVYDCVDREEYEKLFQMVFEHPDFKENNRKSNHTHSSALRLYRRFLAYYNAIQNPPMEEEVFWEEERNASRQAKKLSDSELKERVKRKSKRLSTEKNVITKVYQRDKEVAEYGIRRANGKCDLCTDLAPFLKSDGTPYLEAHHVIWLSRGGEDTIENIVAVCPNCHRKLHVCDNRQDVEKLKKRLIAYMKLMS